MSDEFYGFCIFIAVFCMLYGVACVLVALFNYFKGEEHDN